MGTEVRPVNTDSQAVPRLGGSVSVEEGGGTFNRIATGGSATPANAANKCFDSAVRIVTFEYTPRRITEIDILDALFKAFNESVMRCIDSIGFFQPQFSWIVTFKKGNEGASKHVIGREVTINNEIFKIQDASIPITAPVVKKSPPRILTFRIKGLPVTASEEEHKEISDCLVNIGFNVNTISKVFAQSKLAVKYKIYSDLMDFTVVVADNEARAQAAKLAGDHKITLQGVQYKVSIP